jgi:hypothetical protein
VAVRPVAPRQRVQLALDADPEQLVPRRVELDLVDPLSEAVVRVEARGVLVCEPTQLERLAAAQPPELGAPFLGGATAFAPQRFGERPILGEEVVACE